MKSLLALVIMALVAGAGGAVAYFVGSAFRPGFGMGLGLVVFGVLLLVLCNRRANSG